MKVHLLYSWHHRSSLQWDQQLLNVSLAQWLKDPGPRSEKRTLLCDMACFLLITPLAAISGWLCLRGAQDHLQLKSRLEAVGLIALTIALFTIYILWTLVTYWITSVMCNSSRVLYGNVGVLHCIVMRSVSDILSSSYINGVQEMSQPPFSIMQFNTTTSQKMAELTHLCHNVYKKWTVWRSRHWKGNWDIERVKTCLGMCSLKLSPFLLVLTVNACMHTDARTDFVMYIFQYESK